MNQRPSNNAFILVFGPTNLFVMNSIFNNCLKYPNDFKTIENLNDDSVDKLINDQNDKKKILFTTSFSDFKSVISKCELIIYIHLSEEKFYTESITNRTSYEKYSKIVWPSFVQESKLLLEHTDKCPSIKGILILDFSRSHRETLELLRQISSFFKSGYPIDKKFLLKSNFVYQELDKSLPSRNSDHIWTTFDNFRKILSNQYLNKISKCMEDLNLTNRNIKNRAIDNLIDLLSFKYKKIAEERNIFKMIISKGDTQIPYKRILNEIEYFCQNFDSRVIGLADILNRITDNSKNRSLVLKDPEYKRILMKMLSNDNKIIQIKATELVFTMFKDSAFSNFKGATNNCLFFDKKNSLLEKLLKIIFVSCETIFSCTNYEQVTELNLEYRFLNISCLKEILLGSHENWSRIGIDDFLRLSNIFDMGLQVLRQTKHNFQARLLSELALIKGLIIKTNEVNLLQQINIEKYLRQTLVLMNICLDVLGKFCKTYLFMVYETFNILILLAEKNYFKKEVKSYQFIDESDFFAKKKQIGNDYEDKALNNIVDCYDKYLWMVRKNNQVEKFINFNKDQVKFSIKFSQMEIDLENKKRELEEKNTQIEKFKNQIENLTNDNKNNLDKFKAKINENLNNFTIENQKLIQPLSTTTSKIEIDENNIRSSLDAKIFIKKIEEKYNSINDFRQLICNSLKHLTDGLYSSKYHFIYELIQNVDDAKFDQNPSLKIIIEKDSVTFCSNEKGFSVCDIQSICSISESKKSKGVNIGNKGLGFKSVFSVCDEPVIYSKPFWQFYFLKQNDELSYITPHYLEKIPATLGQIIDENQSMNTFVHLKFKKDFDFNENIVNLLDANVLLFTNKLEQISVEDKILSSTFIYKKQIKRFKKNPSDFELIQLDLNGNKQLEFKVFNEIIKIDENLAKKEELASEEIKLSIAFPNKLSDLNSHSVYSIFPVEKEDIKWPFLINTYWTLVTNRENIKMCKYNQVLRDSLADMYCRIVKTDQILKNNLAFILPSYENLNKWWRNFSSKVADCVRHETKIGLKRFKNKALQEKLDVSDEIIRIINIEIVENLKLNKKDLEYFMDLKEFCVEDILCIFDEKNNCERIHRWIDGRSTQWWSDFFYELLAKKVNLDTSKYRIFQLREPISYDSKDKRKYNKLTNLEGNTIYFTTLHHQLKTWRKEISIIETRNINEAEYLRFLQIQDIEPENMIEIIIASHKKGCISEIDCIWNDLEFLKNHFDIFKDVLFDDVLSLTVPVIGGLLPLKYSKIPTLLCFDLSFLTCDDRIINFSSLKKAFSNYEILEWEHFFINLGLDLPDLNALDTNDIFLRPLVDYDERESELALKILNSNVNLVNFIKLLPIKCSMESCSIKHQTVHLNSIHLPNSHCIKVPYHAMNLAEKMGIHTKLNTSLCINSLEALVLENNKFSDEYLKWFARLQEISGDFFFEDDIQHKKLICLKNLYQEKEFYSPNQVYVSGNNQVIEILGKYKTVINEKLNREFLEFEHLLIKLGFKNEPNIQDLIELIFLMDQDEEIFFNQNFLGNVTFKGQNALKSIYLYLENLLQKKANIYQPINWETRLNLKEIINNSLDKYLNELKSLPVLTVDNKLIRSEILKEKILVASLNDQVSKLFQKENSSTYFVCNSEVAMNCPFLMSIIGCIYLEPNSVIRLSHQTNNMEIIYPLITEMVKINSDLEKIEILNVVYIGADLVYDPLLNRIRKKDIHLIDSLKTLSLHSFDSLLLDNDTLLCSTKLSNKSGFMSVYQRGLGELLSLNFPNENIEQKLNCCMQNLDRNFESLRQRFHNWSKGSTEYSFYDMDQISFLEKKNLPNDHVAANKNNSLSEEKLYKQRILQIISKLPGINRPNEYHIRKKYKSNMSSDRLIEIGKKAETFFYHFLNFIYPGSFEWVSSLKKGIFINNFGFDDRLGYDFVVNFDNKKIFSPQGKKCLIEVKGFGDEWQGNFFFTKKQLNAFKLAEKADDTDYIIVVIDNLNNLSKARIAEIFCLNENPDILRLESEVFKASIYLRTSDFGSSSNFSSLSDILN